MENWRDSRNRVLGSLDRAHVELLGDMRLNVLWLQPVKQLVGVLREAEELELGLRVLSSCGFVKSLEMQLTLEFGVQSNGDSAWDSTCLTRDQLPLSLANPMAFGRRKIPDINPNRPTGAAALSEGNSAWDSTCVKWPPQNLFHSVKSSGCLSTLLTPLPIGLSFGLNLL
ncbi:hypothetical protein RJ639_027668 [Escallonia herrerae]|uniref:Uncharacterized protein n=1 Tax=Escallonia herrerae TaxID=1293975 RepID=A0AA89BDK7_9ASTE|nr:hypothetical protein RJ639_027668 [Escallonia herrerae]